MRRARSIPGGHGRGIPAEGGCVEYVPALQGAPCGRRNPLGTRAAWRGASEVTLAPSTVALVTARAAFSTRLTKPELPRTGAAPDPPPPFQRVHYPAAAGSLVGYLTADPGDGSAIPRCCGRTADFKGSARGCGARRRCSGGQRARPAGGRFGGLLPGVSRRERQPGPL